MLRVVRTTPGLLLAAATAVVLAGLVAGVAGWAGLSARAGALEESRIETQHQVRLQTARTKLVVADTAAGRDVLVGGDRSRLSFRDFDLNVRPALVNVVYAAEQPQDRAKLAVADRYAASYAMQVERARTLAAAGEAVAAATVMRQASGLLQTQVLPRLEQVQKASNERLRDDDRSAARGPLVALVVVIVALAGLAGVHWWLTLRTRRLVNLGLASAATVILVVLLVAAGSVIGSLNTAHDVREGPQATAASLVEGRIAAFDARRIEALAVLGDDVTGSESDWRAALDRAELSLRPVPGLGDPLGAYQQAHQRLLRAARTGSDREVVDIAVNPADGSVGSFDDFDAVTGAALAREVQDADDGWVDALGHLRLIAWLTLAAGLVAAGLAWFGVEQRRREYR